MVTIGIPVYNEEEILRENTARLIDYLRSRVTAFEIVIASNGSTDRTVEIGTAMADEIPEVRFLHIPEAGVGQAFRLIARQARYDVLVSMDMDLAVELDFIEHALDQLAACDIVVGSKMSGLQRRSLFRRLGSETFVVLAAWLLGIQFVDFSIGAKAYRIPAIRPYAALISRGSAYVLDLVFYVHRDGGRVVQIPVVCEDHRPSKFHLGREAIHKFWNLGRLWWRRHAHVTEPAVDAPAMASTHRE